MISFSNHENTFLRKLFTKVILLVVLVLQCNIYAQSNKVDFVRLKLDLSHNTVVNIYQDSAGFMWFGTMNGLNKFDGINITTYENIPGDKNSLSDNTINRIVEAKEGELWVATNNGLNVLNKDNYQFKRYNKDTTSNSLPKSLISDVFIDNNGDIWINSKFPCKYDPVKDNFQIYSLKIEEPSHDEPFFFQDSKGELWFFHMQEIFLFDVAEDTFKPVFNGANCSFCQSYVLNDVVEFNDSTWYVATNGTGIVPLSIVDGIPIANINDEILSKAELSAITTFYELYIDKNNILWMASENGGMFSYSLTNHEFYNYRYDPANEKSIGSNSIWSVFEDNQARLWLGTFSDGVCMIDKNYSKFTHYKGGTTNRSLSYNTVSAFLEDKNGNIWIGTDGGGLNYYDREKNSFTYYKHDPKDKNSISSNAVLALCFDDDDKLWIGTWEAGINIFDPKTGDFEILTPENSSLSSDIAFDIVNNGKGELYIACYNSGIDVFNQATKTWKNYQNDPLDIKSLSNNNTFNLLIDSLDNLWIATQYGGLNYMRKGSDGTISFERFVHDEYDSTSISNNTVLDIFIDRYNKLWVATSTGLNYFIQETKSFKILTKNNGLPTNSIQSITDDYKGNLWLGTLNGLSNYDIESSYFRNYTTQDGLQGNKFVRNSVCKLESGELLFGGTKGFNIFNPNDITKNIQEPRLVFTDFKIFNKSVKIDNNSILNKHIERTDKIELTHKQSVFTIEFVAINYTHPDKNQYAFFLEGLEDEWNYVAYQRNATYTNLDPGEYVFHVKASNNDGVWNEEGITLDITVLPPFWKTWWFRALLIITIIAILLIVYYIRIYQIKRINKNLKETVDLRTAEIKQQNKKLHKQTHDLYESNTQLEERQQRIEEQSEEITAQRDELSLKNEKLIEVNAVKDKLFSIIAHDLKNPFNTILGYSELLKIRYDDLEDKKRKKLVNVLFESSLRVFDLLENLLTWSRAQRGTIKFSPSHEKLSDLIVENIELVLEQASKKQIAVKFYNPNNTNIEIKLDKELINVIMRNLLSNAIKFSLEKSIVSVHLSIEDEKVTIAVKDSGVGISKENQKMLFKKNSNFTTYGTNNEKGTGLGLSMCKDFVEMHGGEIWVESLEGNGSSFYFSLPIKN